MPLLCFTVPTPCPCIFILELFSLHPFFCLALSLSDSILLSLFPSGSVCRLLCALGWWPCSLPPCVFLGCQLNGGVRSRKRVVLGATACRQIGGRYFCLRAAADLRRPATTPRPHASTGVLNSHRALHHDIMPLCQIPAPFTSGPRGLARQRRSINK